MLRAVCHRAISRSTTPKDQMSLDLENGERANSCTSGRQYKSFSSLLSRRRRVDPDSGREYSNPTKYGESESSMLSLRRLKKIMDSLRMPLCT